MNHATKPIPADGSLLSCDAKSYTVHLQRTHDNGFTLSVTAGPTRYDELTQSFTDEAMARNVARCLTSGLRAGISIWQFIADRNAAEQGLIASVNATMDAVDADRHTTYTTEQQAVTDTINPARDGWRRFADEARRNARTVTGRAAALNHVQQRALDAVDVNGVVHVGPGIAKSTLEGLEVRGYGRVLRGGVGRRRFEITGFVANTRGLNARTGVAA